MDECDLERMGANVEEDVAFCFFGCIGGLWGL